MEFWGVEVKAGSTVKVEIDEERRLHMSQAALGEAKKDKNEPVLIFLNINGQKHVIGTLYADKIPHISYDLVFEKDFELSHNWKNGSIYFCGYKQVMGDDDTDSESDFGEGLPVLTKENSKPEPKNELSNFITEKANAAKLKAKGVEQKKVNTAKEDNEESSDDDSDDDDDSDAFESDKEAMDLSGEDSSDEDDDSSDAEGGDSDEDDEDTPKKGKKRPAESVSKTPVPEKKVKLLVTPQKASADGKKGGGHVATPHPSKKAGKTPANDKSKQETPKSAGQAVCKPCNKTFKNDGALQSHSKAKHGDGK